MAPYHSPCTGRVHVASVWCTGSSGSSLISSSSRVVPSHCQTDRTSAFQLVHAHPLTVLSLCATGRTSGVHASSKSTPHSSHSGSKGHGSQYSKPNTRSRTARGRFSSRQTRHEIATDNASAPNGVGVAWYEQPAASPATAQTSPRASTQQQVAGRSNNIPEQRVEGITQPSASDTAAAGVNSGSGSTSRSSSTLTAQLSDHQTQQLQQYLSHMLEVNKSMNLTAIRDVEEAWQRHIEDSLALLPVIDTYSSSSSSSSGRQQDPSAAAIAAQSNSASSTKRRTRRATTAATAAAQTSAQESAQIPAHHQQQQQEFSVIDVGTGAGLPGMVFAIARPHWKVTLLDSLRKRCDFLQATADMLGLTNITVLWSRAEDGGRRADLREAHDLAVARAVADLRVLSELCLPFVRPGGLWVAAKGANPEDEVAAAQNALTKLGGKLLAVERVESWSPEGQRTAVVVAKSSSTPSRFPRPPGTPSKKPL